MTACRALMITAIFLGFLGLLLGIVGLRCTNIGSLELSRKAKLAATAGALHILAGICGMVAISWYAFNITRDFFDPLYPGTNGWDSALPTELAPHGAPDPRAALVHRYELGPALYLGWSASLISMLGGLCLCSTCCCGSDEDAERVWGEGSTPALTGAPPRSARLPYGAPLSVKPVATSDQEDDSSFDKYGKNAYV
ncbi:Claudin-15 [Saguinus oedipus]|uniref:Claudin-15 n=1 Tax=Saguinus oedipus TaxID=9490 RepID=A0ABQ9W780_SAGOE|nr:Claudin-15 [Saguinus oedipus]